MASAHPLASRAGRAMLAAGGSVVDAAIATSFVLSVVEPQSSGLGGGGFMVLRVGGKSETWDFREAAPAAATPDMFIRFDKVDARLSQRSMRSAGIPGLVKGLMALHRAHGRLPLAVVMAPAVRYAEDGFAVTPQLRAAIEAATPQFNSEARGVFLDAAGAAPAVGATLRQRDLARTLRAIAASAGAAFYKGDGSVARELVRAVRAERGIWTAADLTSYRAVRRPPVLGTYRGYTVVSMGPPSSGGLLLVQMLGVLERLGGLDRSGASRGHRLAEVMKRAYAMRARALGDPDHILVDRERFVGGLALDRLTTEVRAAAHATPGATLAEVEPAAAEGDHTSHFGILLASGDAVACTQTINLTFGNGHVAGATGVVLNDEMDDFAAAPGVPNAFGLVGDAGNAIAPRKRPLSSMTPTLLLRDDQVVGVFGSPGGSRIITTTLQTILAVVDRQATPAQALEAPRMHHQWLPDVLWFEAGAFRPREVEALRRLGHDARERGSMGNAMVLWRPAGHRGQVLGACDPRGEGQPAGL